MVHYRIPYGKEKRRRVIGEGQGLKVYNSMACGCVWKREKGEENILEYEKLHINSEFCNGPYFIQNFVLCTTHFICRALEVEFTHLFLDAEKQNPVKFGTVSRNVGNHCLKDIHRKFDK